MKLDFTNGTYCVPKDLLNIDDKSATITYIGIRRFVLACTNKNGTRYSVFSIRDFCENANISSKNRGGNSYIKKVRNHLQYFQEKNLIKNIGANSKKDFQKIGMNEEIILSICPEFFPKNNFAKITDEEFNALIEKHYTVSKEILVATYVYVKSFMYDSEHFEEGKFCAFFQDLYTAAYNLNISRHKIDRCMEFYVKNGLLIKHQVGSYKYLDKVLNAPNIYVLNNADAKMNISSALNVLKFKLLKQEYGNNKNFMPVVYTGKKTTKKGGSDYED